MQGSVFTRFHMIEGPIQESNECKRYWPMGEIENNIRYFGKFVFQVILECTYDSENVENSCESKYTSTSFS